MNYILNINGAEIMVEMEKTEQRDRLQEYYTKLLSARGVALSDKQKKSLNSLVQNMTEAAATQKLSNVEQSQLNRLMAYAAAFNQLTKEEEMTADALLEVIDAMEDDPEQEAVMINGNKFVFEKNSIDLEKYKDKLFEIGNKQKGNTWFIYTDEEGELVIY